MPSPSDKMPLSDSTSLRTFDPQALANLLAENNNLRIAQLRDQATNPQSSFVKVGPIPLDSAPLNVYKLPSPLTSIVLKDVTDDTVRVSLITGSDAQFSVLNAYPMDHNEALNFKDPINYAFLTWTAQVGKTATLFIGIGVEVRPGKIISVQSGSVSIGEGLAPTLLTPVTVTNVATQILAADSARNTVTIQNQGGADVYIGDATVKAWGDATSPGIKLVPGQTWDIKNAGAWYGITGGQSAVISILQQK